MRASWAATSVSHRYEFVLLLYPFFFSFSFFFFLFFFLFFSLSSSKPHKYLKGLVNEQQIMTCVFETNIRCPNFKIVLSYLINPLFSLLFTPDLRSHRVQPAPARGRGSHTADFATTRAVRRQHLAGASSLYSSLPPVRNCSCSFAPQ